MPKCISQKLFKVMGSISLTIMLAVNIGWAGSVTPLPENSKSSAGVESLLEKERQGSVQPPPEETTDVRRVIAEGFASISGGNVEQARFSALRMAYAEAVGRVAGLEVTSLTWILNVRHVTDIVTSRSKGFIRSYRIIREGLSDKDPNRYEVLIEAEVMEHSSSQIDERQGLQLFLKLLGDPKLLIMLPEKQYKPEFEKGTNGNTYTAKQQIEVENNDTKIRIESSESQDSKHLTKSASGNQFQGTVMGSAEAALARAFSAYGYQVVTSDDLLAQGLVEPDVLRQAKAGVTAQAVKVARAAGADLALLGVMRVSRDFIKPVNVDMIMITAEASAKALIVSSGRMIQAFHESTRASAPTELKAYADCMDKAANGIASVLAWKIPQILTRESRQTELIIRQVSLPQAERVIAALKSVDGIVSARFSQVPTQTEPNAVFILRTGFVRIAPEEILRASASALGKGVKLISANKFKIEIKL